MQYHVTCNKCNRAFTITADSGERMHCTCPYCGQPLLVNLPAMASPASPVVQQPAAGQGGKDNRGSGLKILLTVLIVLVLGAAGIFAFVQWQDSQEAARLEKQARLKAHADSLMQIRAQQNAQEAEAQRTEAQRKSVCSFIKSFYLKAVLLDDPDVEFYERYLTDYARRMVFGVASDPDAEDYRWLSWQDAFGNRGVEPDYDQLQRNINVVPAEGNWYKVRLSQNGETVYRHIKVLTQDGHVLIDDVR